jgi:hypothetical protein
MVSPVLKKYKINIAAMFLTIFAVTLTFSVVWWQQDILLGWRIDWTRTYPPPQEILPGWRMWEADYYVLLFMSEFVAYIVIIIGLIASLWTWDYPADDTLKLHLQNFPVQAPGESSESYNLRVAKWLAQAECMVEFVEV